MSSDTVAEKHERGIHLADQGHFWLGLGLEPDDSGSVADGRAMYVEYQIPFHRTQPYPLVMIHGGGAQGLDWCGTPDGRPGWRDLALGRGFAVYVVDRPGHGRATGGPHGPAGPGPTAEGLGRLFAGADEPAATQWPGSGRGDDPAVLALLAGAASSIPAFDEHHRIMRERGAELIDRIGPAIVIANSAGSAPAWLMADARPEQVRAVVALEPLGPSMSWGIAEAPLVFDPPAETSEELGLVDVAAQWPGNAPQALYPRGLPPIRFQQDPPRRLPNLARVPLAVVTGEASFATDLDTATVEFLRQAGCPVEHLRLGELGVMGNGHLPMLEKNNAEVLDVVLDWLDRVLAVSP